MDDPVLLSRLQFAITIMFHYIFPPMTIGLGVVLVALEGLWLKTKNDLYHKQAKFWTRIFGIIFALGVASGIVMEFQFGTNWADYSRCVGDIFGSPLAAEGIFAFFLESGFLAILLFGWDKVGPKMHFLSSCMVALGAHFSAIWIIVANSWMQTPAGYKLVEVNGKIQAHITSFYDVVFNPSTVDRLTHALAGCWLAGATLVLSVSAWYILKKRFTGGSEKSFKVALVIGLIGVAGMGITGDSSAREVSVHQPAKFAAMEGVMESGAPQDLHLIGWMNPSTHEVTGISIPYLLTLLTHHDLDTSITGMNDIPQDERPPILPVFYSFHLMILIGCALAALFLAGLWGWKRGWLFQKRWLLWCFVFSVLGPQIANQAGWAVAELGRQPWIVYGILRTEHAVSPTLTAAEALSSLGMFFVIYALLLALFLYQITHKIHKVRTRKLAKTTAPGKANSRFLLLKTNLYPSLKIMLDNLTLADLQIIWFILVGVLFSGYAILDGFDLGTGALQLFIKGDENRRLTLNAVGPVWDGNEVWLITGGGALFAAFPYVYASVFSGFYLAFMLLLLTLIFRAVSIEFRSKQPMKWWRRGWDTTFSISSLLAALLIGVAMGNVTKGIPLDDHGNFTGTFLSLLNPYSILLGLTTVALFAMHGGIYLLMKTQGSLQEQIRKLLRPCVIIFTVLIILHGAATLLYVPHVAAALERSPWIYGIAALAVISIASIWIFIHRNRPGWAFVASCSTMGCMMALFGTAMFPNLLYSMPNPEHSLTLANGSSTRESLVVMTYIAILGVPLVLAYSAAIYWVFRGKVQLNEHSY